MKYKFTKKFQKELRPSFENRRDPVLIGQDLARNHGTDGALGLLVSALGSLYTPIKEDDDK